MSIKVATPELVRQRVAEVLEQRPDASAIAIRAEPRWDSGDLTVDGRRAAVRTGRSPLEVRQHLADWTVDRAGESNDVLVVICDLAENDLGADVLARFVTGQLVGLNSWRAVERLFGATALDPAIRNDDGWIADAALASFPAGPKTALLGALTRDHALDLLGRTVLGVESLDVDAALDAAADGHLDHPTIGPPADVRSSVLAAFADRNGDLGRLVADTVAAGRADDLVALGIAARGVYGDGSGGGGSDAGRLEAHLGGRRITGPVGARFADRAEAAVQRLLHTDATGAARAATIVARAATIADEIASSTPAASDLLPSGYEHRLQDLGRLLDAVLDDVDARRPVGPFHLADIRAQRDLVARHRDAGTPLGSGRAAHAYMAARLTAWLATPVGRMPASFEHAATDFAGEGAWVDWARRRLWRGDSDPAVGTVYRRIVDRVVERRRDGNRRFAELLAAWTTAPTDAAGLAPHHLVKIEDVLGRVVAPLAADTGVLLVVLDGCGLPTFVELAGQMPGAGFVEVVPEGEREHRMVGIAALPTVTEISRASLLAGRIDDGDQAHERRQFAANPVISIGGKPGQLFHQNRLRGPAGTSLSADLSDALGPGGPRVVGVVINTVDDQLKRGNFTAAHRIDDLDVFTDLLAAARNHGRAVIVTADHGHVLAQPSDGGTGEFQGGGSGGERWRRAERPAGDTEVQLRGDRVRVDGAPGTIIAPWDDDFRYSAKAGGYHGGATPEEVLVPVAVFLAAGIEPSRGWARWQDAPPMWWDVRVDEPVASAPPARRRREREPDPAQTSMFDLPASPPVAAATAGHPAWIDALLRSDVWQAQAAAVNRAALPEARVRSVLGVISRRGVASFAAIAADTDLPINRVSGFTAILTRVLNVDGYSVLDVDTTAQEARLDRALLTQQFGVPT